VNDLGLEMFDKRDRSRWITCLGAFGGGGFQQCREWGARSSFRLEL